MDKLLSIRVIEDIQKQLSALNWAQTTDYKGELLESYLSGIETALFETGLTLKLCVKKENYNNTYFVRVEQYEDYADCWSLKVGVGEIYEKEVYWV